MNTLFPPELRTASVVKRWSIVRTLFQDSIAEHQYYVTYYALQIARLVEWKGSLDQLMLAAMLHDAEELITGDLVSPVKKEITDPDKYMDFVESQMKERLPLFFAQLDGIEASEWAKDIRAIIKVADKVDALIFLIIEMRMGNATIQPLYNDALRNLEGAWQKFCSHIGVTQEWGRRQWDDHLYPAIQAHHKFGGVGLT